MSKSAKNCANFWYPFSGPGELLGKLNWTEESHLKERFYLCNNFKTLPLIVMVELCGQKRPQKRDWIDGITKKHHSLKLRENRSINGWENRGSNKDKK